MIPKRRKPQRSGIRDNDGPLRLPSHLKWIRGLICAVPYCENNQIEAAHIRIGTDGGMGVKPSDSFTIPLCRTHHQRSHDIGETSFENEHKIRLRMIAAKLWEVSPARKKLEAKERDNVR